MIVFVFSDRVRDRVSDRVSDLIDTYLKCVYHRRDKRIFEQYQKASRALPDKKERDEITILKTKVSL